MTRYYEVRVGSRVVLQTVVRHRAIRRARESGGQLVTCFRWTSC